MDQSQKEYLFRGGDETGNILKIDNISAFTDFVNEKSQGRMADLCTADGGFDVNDKNNQEEDTMRLVVAQVLTAFMVLKEKGNFVLKLFDTFTEESEILLFILTLFFEQCSLYKPFSSRVCNSEKYFIGKNFIGLSQDSPSVSVNDMISSFEFFVAGNPLALKGLVNVPHCFKLNLRHFNQKFADMQVGYLQTAIKLTRHMKDEDKISKQDMEALYKTFKSDQQARGKASAYCMTMKLLLKQ